MTVAMADRKRVVVLGGGIGGLAAAYFIGRTGQFEVTVLEQAPHVGGMCASFRYDGFTLDHGAHKMYSVIPGVLDELLALMGDRVIRVPKKNRILLQGGLLDYPVALANLGRVLGPFGLAKMGLGYAFATAARPFERNPERSYEDYIVRRFGRPVYDLVFAPLAEKVWGEPSELHPDMARTRLPASSGFDVLLRALHLKPELAETNAEFFYYPRLGFGDFPETLRRRIEERGDRVLVNAAVTGVELEGRRVTAVRTTIEGSEQRLPCEVLVSSLPLALIGRLVFADSDPEFTEAVTGLQFRHLLLVYVEVRRPLALEDQWIFVPEREFVFSRVFEQKQMNAELGPPDRTVLCCDFTSRDDGWQWNASDEALGAACVDGLVRAGFVGRDEVLGTFVKRQRNFYPRYDLRYAQKMQTVSDRLRRTPNLLTTGRIGMYNYNNSDHCTDMGRFIADGLARDDPPPEIWAALEQRVRGYRIVD
jgi:protoporphyrinogen oxidase